MNKIRVASKQATLYFYQFSQMGYAVKLQSRVVERKILIDNELVSSASGYIIPVTYKDNYVLDNSIDDCVLYLQSNWGSISTYVIAKLNTDLGIWLPSNYVFSFKLTETQFICRGYTGNYANVYCTAYLTKINAKECPSY